MNREIKFRVWDVKAKNIEDDVFGIWASYCLRDGSLRKLDGPAGGEFSVPTKDVLMQYTGLQDVNGKDIYEGDIIKGLDGTDNQGQSNVFYGYGVWQPFAYLGTYMSSDFEVIGNIYENSELLKDK